MTATQDSPENQSAELSWTTSPTSRAPKEVSGGSDAWSHEYGSRHVQSVVDHVQSVVDRDARLIRDRDARINRM